MEAAACVYKLPVLRNETHIRLAVDMSRAESGMRVLEAGVLTVLTFLALLVQKYKY